MDYYKHPAYDPAVEAQVAAWVKVVKRRDWETMDEPARLSAYIDYAVIMSDEDVDKFLDGEPL